MVTKRPPITVETCLFLDFETKSVVDLRKCGAHVYFEHPDTDVLCARFSLGWGPMEEWMHGDPVPETIKRAFADPNIFISAHNAGFEFLAINGPMSKKHGWPTVPYSRMHCTAAEAAAMALPRSLEGVGSALGLDVQKDQEGYRLMMQMCKPRKPRKDEDKTKTYWWHEDPETGAAKMKRLSEYCAVDVLVARSVFTRLRRLSDTERAVWELDGKINNTGIYIDMEAVHNAKAIVDMALAAADRKIARLTNGQVPKSSNAKALLTWINFMLFGIDPDIEPERDDTGEPISTGGLYSIDKATVRELLLRDDLPTVVREVLTIRTDVGGAAVKKLNAMIAACNTDNRARGSHLYCGAATGRFSSQRIQFQNVVRDVLKNQDVVIEDFKYRDLDHIEVSYGPAIGIVARCLRGMVRAAPGHRLFVCDYSNVEGRGVAFLGGEEAKLEAFRLADAGVGPGIYEVAAAAIYKVPVESIDKESKERQVGKVSELACLSGGQKVLTNIGLIPIEKITKKHLLWDGEEFVSHDGAICKGRRETIGYDGIRATDDHVVFTADGKMPLIEAVRKSIPLIGTGIAASTTSPDPRPYVTAKALVKSFGGKRLEMTYDILNAGPRNRFTCNGRLVSNCGYGGGPNAFQKMAKAHNVLVSEEEADDIKTAWRKANPNIVKLWRGLEEAAVLATRNPGVIVTFKEEDVGKNSTISLFDAYPNIHKGLAFMRTGGFLFMRLPSGRRLSYANPRTRVEDVTFTYKDKNTGKKVTKTEAKTVLYCDALNSMTKKFGETSIYGGLLAENCLATGTLVITDSGTKPIEQVNKQDLLWDGENWVLHSGLIYKGEQDTIEVDGVWMTPDHLVLTVEGWKSASQSRGFDRAAVRPPTGDWLRRFKRGEVLIPYSMRLRDRKSPRRQRVEKREDQQLWLSTKGIAIADTHDTWHVEASGIFGLALDGRPLRSSYTSGLEKLWRAWDNSVRGMARVFREFLGGYGECLRSWTLHRQDRQYVRVLAGELSLGDRQGEFSEYEGESGHRNQRVRAGDDSRSGGTLGHRVYNAAISDRQRLADEHVVHRTGRYEQVYDIANSGPLQRFAIIGESGPFIVHNCTQAMCRDLLTDAMLKLDTAGYKAILHVHDEIVAEVPDGFGSFEEFKRIMCELPEWASDFPQKAAGGASVRYHK